MATGLLFFVAGLDLKRELVIASLSRLKNALLPVIGAAGGMVVPAGGFALLGAHLPRDLGKRDLVAVAVLGGAGFTVSLLLADLSLDGADREIVEGAVLAASLIASLVAAVLLLRRSKAHSAS